MDQFLAVTSDPVPGREDEYETWYNDAHLPEVLSIPGFAAARRFVATDVDPVTGQGWARVPDAVPDRRDDRRCAGQLGQVARGGQAHAAAGRRRQGVAAARSVPRRDRLGHSQHDGGRLTTSDAGCGACSPRRQGTIHRSRPMTMLIVEYRGSGCRRRWPPHALATPRLGEAHRDRRTTPPRSRRG